LLTCCCCIAHAQTDSVLYQKQPTANNVLAARLQPIKGEKQYLTAELIRIHGISRISELITWIDKTTFSSIQHDRFYVNFNGTSTLQEQSYLLMINGQKIETERWDALYLNQLGIAITDIAYVEIITSPQIINGQFAGKGAINIVTRTDYKGLTVSGYNNYGNPINDPGPANYVKGYGSPNIHKTGLVYGYALGYYGTKGHINISHNHEDWFLRDTQAISRITKFDPMIYKNTMSALRVEGAYDFGKYLVEAGAATSTSDGFVYRNYLQSEIPANITYNEARLRATRLLAQNAYIRSNVVVNTNGFTHPATLYENYTYTTSTANVEYGTRYNFNKRVLKQTSGYTLDYQKYSTGTGWLLQHKPYSGFIYYPSKKVSQQLDVNLNIFNNTVNPSISFKREKNSSIINGSSFIASYQQSRLNTSFNQLWMFYGINRNGINPPSYPGTFSTTPTHLFTADYFYFISSGSSFKININPGIRFQHNYHFIHPDNVATYPLTGKNTSGQTADFYTITLGTNIHYDVFNNFWFDIDYYSAADRSASKQMQQLLNSDAKRKLCVSFYLKLPARIDIGIRSQAVSKTSWMYFDMNGNLVSTTIPSVFTTDISFNKKLWGEHIMVNATIRNLFNQREQYYPIGADFQMRLFVSAIVKFENLLRHIPKRKP
jgi:hypothetical protein